MTNDRTSKSAKINATSTAPWPTPAASADPRRRLVHSAKARLAPAWLLLATCCLATLTLGLVSCSSSKDRQHLSPSSLLSPTRELDAQLRAAEAAWPAATAPDASPEAVAAYNRQVSLILDTIQDAPRDIPWSKPFTTNNYTLTFAPGAINSPLREIYNLTEAVQASRVKIKNASRRIQGDGLGVACVTVRGLDSKTLKTSRFVPPNGRWLPTTFLVDFSTPGKPEGKFFNTQVAQTTKINRRQAPLAYDFSAGLELSLGSGFLKKLALTGLLKPGEAAANSGLFFTEAFNPKRIPVIMVHGLASDPHIWQNVMNEIMADPVLRENYQLWFFLYPTGLPVAGTSNRLRQAIQAAIQTFDPEDDDPALKDMVLVGHSMGGLLSRMQVIDSGHEIWGSYFAVPPEKLTVSREKRQQLEEALYFQKSNYIDRTIFVATPHRGSEIADLKIVRWAVNFIRLPLELVSLTTDFAKLDMSFFNPELRKFDAFGTRSVDNLSPQHPLLHGLNKRPITVPHHSIIGNRGKSGPLEQTSDGIVPYLSAQLETAESEKIVPAPHSCVQHPEVAEEIVRILHENLQKNRKPAGKRRPARAPQYTLASPGSRTSTK